LIQKDFRPIPGWSLLTFLVLAPAAGIAAVMLMGESALSDRGQLLATGVLYGVGLAAIAIAVAPLGRDAAPALALRPASWRIVLLGVVGIIALSVAVTQVGPELQGMKDAERIIRKPDSIVLGILVIGVLAPLVEELTFRGMLYGWLEGRWGWRPAFWVSSLAFAIAHYQWTAEGWMRLAYALAVLPLGLLFGWLRRRTGSLLPSVVAHMVNNSFSVVAILYGL
jgi:membrane protease YdiL (CAAX protease family)